MHNYSKKLLNIFLIVSAMLVVSIAGNAADDAGVIKGKVNYCGKGGYIGMQVFIPGRTFMAMLGADGNFLFQDVPVGTYDLNYVINGKLVNENKNINVTSGATFDLGEISFCGDNGAQAEANANAPKDPCEENPDAAECLDADKDGVLAAKDCNDNDATIRPGAIELCDGIDNNCNGQVDEQLTVNIVNGIGTCTTGKVSVKACNKGFDDCDKDPANGCETDIFNDRENCGSCGNSCSAIESCSLGMC